MNEAPVPQKTASQTQSSTSGLTQMTLRQPYISQPIASKHVCFYKSGDAQFSGLPVVINSRTFKTFEALLDSLSKRVPLPFGVRTITTPGGHTAVRSLDQLHHGQSYICSDQRTVKPVDLERARRKLPPWYHARPMSAGRLAWQALTTVPRGTHGARQNKRATLLHTPKRLVVFRNGEPEVKHTLMLQKRTTTSFEALLQHISEVMTFPVLRLYAPDGRRVDGLPALILCSGVLVAAGREAFKKENYDIQKTSPPTWLPAKRVGRLHPIKRKKKSSMTKSRPFSPSSERYVLEQIHNSIKGSTCDFPSNPAGSLEIESGQHLESVAETDMITCLDGEGDIHVPPDDDIEKSFRVNQDGSMTVEMKVRLTIKEEETVHWTTTVSRSSMTNQITALPDSSPDLDAHLPSLDDPVTVEVKENDPDNSHLKNCEANEKSKINGDAVVMDKQHPSSPPPQSTELHRLQQTQSLVESIRTLTDTNIQESSLYYYKEQLDNGEMMEKHCKVNCSQPVPKPRVTLASEMNTTTTTRMQSSSYRASEILQLQENGKEMCETVLHIFEKQTCHENFSGNMQPGFHGFGTPSDNTLQGHLASSNTDSTATSNTSIHSSNADMKPRTWETYKHQTHGKQRRPTQRAKEPLPHTTPASVSQKTSISKRISTPSTMAKKKPARVIVKKNYLQKTANPERKQRDIKADILKEIRKIRADLLIQTGAMKEHLKANAVQNQRNNLECAKLKKEQSEENDSTFTEDPKISQAFPNKSLLQTSQPGTLTRQTSMHEEGGLQNQSQEISQCMSLPAVHSSPSLKNEYVELWLQNSQPSHIDEEPLTTTKAQKSTFHNGNERSPLTEVSHIIEDKNDGDSGPQDSVSNLDSVLKTAELTNNSTTNTTSSPSFIEHLPTNTSLGTPASHVMTPMPRILSLKEPSNGLNITTKKTLSLNQKDTPAQTLQGTPLTSQPFLETIPKNNTMVKALLFNDQSVEKTLLSTKERVDKKGNFINPSWEKVQLNRENTTQPREAVLISDLKNKNISSVTSQDMTLQQRNLQIEKCYTVKMAVIPDMKPALDNLCCSLRSLRKITKRPASLNKSKSVADMSSHLASTFGSSSGILYAFLSIMTLKDGLQNLKSPGQDGNHLRSSEALRILQSLQDFAETEDPDQLRQQLTNLYTSASKGLIQKWRGFQELSNKTKSHSIIVDTGKSHQSSNEEEQAIQKLMEDLGVPERVREELEAIRNMGQVSDSPLVGKENGFTKNHPENIKVNFSDGVLEGCANLYVSSVIDKAVTSHLQESSTSLFSMTESLSTADTETFVTTERHEKDSRGEKVYNVNRTVKQFSIPDSDFCEEMPSIESSCGMETNREFDLKTTKVQEMKVRHIRHQETEKEMSRKVERQKGTDEGRGTLEELNSEGENCPSLEDVTREMAKDKQIYQCTDANKDSEALRIFEGKETFYERQAINEEGENEICDGELVCFSEGTSYNEEENLIVKCPQFDDDTEQTYSEEEISEHWQSHCKFQTIHIDQEAPTRTDTGLPEQRSLSFFLEPNLEVGEIQHSNTPQDFCIDNVIYSDKEHVIIETPECYTIYQEIPQEIGKYEEKEIEFIEETNSPTNLKGEEWHEKNRPCNTQHVSGNTLLNHIHVNVEIPLTKTIDSTSTDPLSSSLAFSYDTKTSCVATDPEANIQINRVKSIREMFLAKSTTDKQHGRACMTSRSSDSGDMDRTQQDKAEASKDDEDTCRLAIAKGYVKRTIERLYEIGIKGEDSDVDRSSSTHKDRKRKGPKGTNVTSLASIHEARTNVSSDLSYFNATSSTESFNDPSNTSKALATYKDAVLIDRGRWLLRETQTSPKSSQQAEDISKDIKLKEKVLVVEKNSEKEDAPYSLFGPTIPGLHYKEQEEHAESTGTTFTYIHLPNNSDPEMETDNIEHAKRKTENTVTPLTKSDKGRTEKHGILTVFSLPDIKKPNKVQPILDTTPPVVAQPTTGQSVQTKVVKHSAEPDALETLYLFCGQHCPLL